MATATRQRILDSARRVFAERGFDAATNRQIAEGCGITTAALYYYFSSKLELYLEVHAEARRTIYERFAQASVEGGLFVERLSAVLAVTHELNRADPTMAQFLAAARIDMARHPEMAEELARRSQSRADFFGRLADDAVAAGEVAPEHRHALNALVVAVLAGMTDELSDNPEHHAQVITGFLLALRGEMFTTSQTR